MKYVDLYRRGYILVDADHERVQGEVWHVPTIDALSAGETFSAGFVSAVDDNALMPAAGPSPARSVAEPA
jgi:alkaline phosphatase D